MNIEIGALALSILIFLQLILGIVKKIGVQKSISDSAKKLTSWQQVWFYWSIILFSLPIMIAESNLLIFISIASMGFVASTAHVSDKMSSQIHNVSAYIGIIAPLVYVMSFGGFYVIAPITGVLASILIIGHFDREQKRTGDSSKNRSIWWIEIIAYAVVVFSLLFKKVNTLWTLF